MFYLNTETNEVKSYEDWLLDKFDNLISIADYDRLLECDELGEILWIVL